MKAGMVAWWVCAALCFFSLAYGHLALSAYFLVLTCLVPPFVAKELGRRQRS
jgi:hypothetical protein